MGALGLFTNANIVWTIVTMLSNKSGYPTTQSKGNNFEEKISHIQSHTEGWEHRAKNNLREKDIMLCSL